MAANTKKTKPPLPSLCTGINPLTFKLPKTLAAGVKAVLQDWTDHAKIARLWTLDAKLWRGTDEGAWLGWLNIADQQLNSLGIFDRVIAEAKSGRYTDALVLGMGGSSLCPEVLAMTFGRIKGFPRLHVLDSTNPDQVRTFADKLDLKKTLFIVASKSGSTLEPNIFKAYFFDRARQALGVEKAKQRFVIITDPGSAMEQAAHHEGIPQEHIFYGVRSIGGRFSALSNFGLVPAAVMGLDIAKYLGRAKAMVQACSPGNSGRDFGCVAQRRPQQAHADRVTGHSRPRRLARTTHCGIHRQRGKGDHTRGPRGPRRSGGLWRRPAFRVPPARTGA